MLSASSSYSLIEFENKVKSSGERTLRSKSLIAAISDMPRSLIRSDGPMRMQSGCKSISDLY